VLIWWALVCSGAIDWPWRRTKSKSAARAL